MSKITAQIVSIITIIISGIIAIDFGAAKIRQI